MAYSYSPIIKDLGFNPSPIAGKIPYDACSITNPDCVGSRLHTEFWEEQIYYCLNGYKTGGLFIPPRYYYYMNFTLIDGVGSGKIYPYFTDIHYELFSEEYEARKSPDVAGLVIPKKRRAGLSFFGMSMIEYGMRFVDGYRAGVAGGLEKYVKGFRDKLYRCYNDTAPEFKINHIIRNKEEFLSGYELDTEQGFQQVLNGTALFATMSDSATKMEGEYFHDVIIEECGEFPLADQAITSIGPALKKGMVYKGLFFVYGTGGRMQKGGKTFAAIYHNAESSDMVRFFIPAKRFLEGYVRTSTDEYSTPNLDEAYPRHSFERLLGCEDVVAAQEALDKEKAKLAKNPNKKKLIQHLQNYPDTVEDVFSSSGSNDFDANILYQQKFNIDELGAAKYGEYVLDLVKDSDGFRVLPLEVTARVATAADKDYNIVKIYQHPDNGYKDLDVGGCDSYNEDQTNTSKSLGGIAVLRDYESLTGDVEEPGFVPVLTYYARPPRKEQHWEMTLKVAVYYNLKGNMMIYAESDACIKYFTDNGGKKYLSLRPREFDSPDSQQLHKYGIKMNKFSKPKLLGSMQTWVVDSAQYCWFPEIINDFASYDKENIGTDWDLADAVGAAISRKVDRKRKPKKVDEDDQLAKDRFSLDYSQGTENPASIESLFGRMSD